MLWKGWGSERPFFNCATCALTNNLNKLSQFHKALELKNDQVLTVGLSVLMSSTYVVAFTSVPKARIPTVVIAPEVVKTTVLVSAP